MRLQVLLFEENPVLPVRYLKSQINEHLDCYCPTVTVRFWTVTVWPLLRFLTISGGIEVQFMKNLCRSKDKTWGYKFYDLRRTQLCLEDSQNHSSTNTWTLTVRFLNCYCLTSTQIFTISGVIELWFKRNLCRWKDMTWGYKFYDLRRTYFCL
jgi:hypothetical protein